MKWIFISIEWFLNLFISKKAKELQNQEYLERQRLLQEYLKAKKKFNNKYSGKRRYTKA